MSIFGNLGKVFRRTVLPAVGTAIGGPALGAAVGALTAPRSAASLPTVLPGAGQVSGFAATPVGLPATIGRAGGRVAQAAGLMELLPDIGAPGPGVFSQTKPPAGYHLSKRPPYHFVKNRRMNPANGKAAMRAIRRIKATRKLLQKIEKQLPTRTVHRRAPRGHARHLHHKDY